MNPYLSYTLQEVLKEFPKAKKYEVGGCLVVDTGSFSTFTKKGKKFVTRDSCRFFDSKTGYVFIGNYPTVEKAKQVAEGQKVFGVEAIVGPMAPYPFGEPIYQKLHPDGAGVYYHLEPRQLKKPVKKSSSSKLPIIKTNSSFMLTKKRVQQVNKLRDKQEAEALKKELVAKLQARQKELQQRSGPDAGQAEQYE